MARPKKVADVDGNSVNLVEKNDKGLSVAKDPLTGDWVVVQIAYDLGSGETSPPDVLFRERDKSLAIERFKILVAQELF